jgi:hypothetical protein
MTESDPIEIKVNIAGKVDDALTALELDEGEPRDVWFLDDLTEGAAPLPLLTAGVILRLRRHKRKQVYEFTRLHNHSGTHCKCHRLQHD